MRSHLPVAASIVLAAVVLAACGAGKNSAAKLPASSTPAMSTPLAGAATPTAPRPVPAVGAVLSGCSDAVGPANPARPAASPTPRPFAPGPQPVRPAIDLSKLTVPPSFIPAPFTKVGDGAVGAPAIAKDALDPQGSLNRLNTIGFLGGREQIWTGPAFQGRIPTRYVQYIVFSSDAGASDFLRAPILASNLCVHVETGPALGQEAISLVYRFSLALEGGGTGDGEGHGVLWRCGRVLTNVTGSAAPGQVQRSEIDDLARKVFAQFNKVERCS